MVLVQAKESKKTSPCANTDCKQTVYQGKPYIWDTDGKKAYCSKECAEKVTGQKVADNSGNSGERKPFSGFKPQSQQLWRSPEEATAAITIWHQTVMPMIQSSTDAILGKLIIGVIEDSKAGVPRIEYADLNGKKVTKIDYFHIYQAVTKTYKEIFLGKMETPVSKA